MLSEHYEQFRRCVMCGCDVDVNPGAIYGLCAELDVCHEKTPPIPPSEWGCDD